MMPVFRHPHRSVLYPILIIALLLIGLGPWAIAVRSAEAQTLPRMIEGRAIDVADGDTFVLLDDLGKRWRVRLAGIDAPESSQPWADRSRQQLRQWLRDERIVLQTIKTDPYGRLVARTLIADPNTDAGRVDVGLRLVESGLAWHFKRYKADQTPSEYASFAQAENHALRAQLGLWSEADPEPPWVFRERQRAARR